MLTPVSVQRLVRSSQYLQEEGKSHKGKEKKEKKDKSE
jgi:hypothetical protein